MDTPFAMSFEDIKAQADANMQADKGQKAAAPSQTQSAGGKSFLDMVNEAERQLAANTNEEKSVKSDTQTTEQASVPTGVSFEEMFAQAQGATAQSASAGATFEDLFSQAQGATIMPQPTVQSEAQTEAPKAPITFDNMFDAAKTETAAETQTKQPISFDDILKQTQTEAAQTAAQDENKTVKTSKGSGGRKKKEPEEKKEPLPDNTDDYKIDLQGTGQESNPDKAVSSKKDVMPVEHAIGQYSGPLYMDALFTPEEIEAFRADIRAFVRKEFKTAMVDAVKELLTEFGE